MDQPANSGSAVLTKETVGGWHVLYGGVGETAEFRATFRETPLTAQRHRRQPATVQCSLPVHAPTQTKNIWPVFIAEISTVT